MKLHALLFELFLTTIGTFNSYGYSFNINCFFG